MKKQSLLGIAAVTALALNAKESRADFYEALEPQPQGVQSELQVRGEWDYDTLDAKTMLVSGVKFYVNPFYVATHVDNNLNGSLEEVAFEGGEYLHTAGAWSFLLTEGFGQRFTSNEGYVSFLLKTTYFEQEKDFTIDAGVGYNHDLDGFTAGFGKAGNTISLQATLGNYVGKHWLVGVEDVGELYLLRDNTYSVQIRPLVRYNTKEWSLTGFTGFSQYNGAGNVSTVVVSGLSLKVGGIVQRE